MSLPHVAIVILNWNGQKHLAEFLPSVMATAYPNHSIIVADNGSTDDSVDFLTTNYPDIRITKLAANYGFAKGYNEALKQVDADYYMLLNSDVQVTPGWIEPLVNLAESDSKIAACQPKILSYKNPSLFEYAGAAGGWLDAYGYPFSKGRIFDICETDKGQYDQSEPIFWASGAALFIRAKVFHDVGGFDNYFFAHQEEIDLCWRVQLAGYIIMSCPASTVYHLGGGTLPKGNSLKTYLNFRNNHIMIFKNMRGWRKWYTTACRLVLDFASAFKSLLGGDGSYFTAVMSAYLSFAKWLFVDYKKSIFPKSKKGKVYGVWNGNIAVAHFLKGKKKFSEIVKDDEV
ncbi:MAG: glycosyltransferase family 2 protein [Niabella sp.]